MREEILIESKSMRESVIDRVEVLDKVKKLYLLPDNINITIEMAANYYEVEKSVIDMTISRNRAELESDGLHVKRGSELTNFKLESVVPKNTPSLTVMPRRALLRIGMLIQDSEVARQVRSYLLDAEQEVNKGMNVSALSPQLQFMIQMEQRTNELESKHAELNQAFTHLSLVVDNEVWITDHQKADIKQAVLSRVGHLKSQTVDAHFQGAFSDLNKFFNVPKYDKIKRSDYAQAMEFVKGWFPKRKESTSL
ncbi:ORF6C domain-containing protein [Paenibacillus sp. FSL R7-0210]|uniref:ORF6C domain-containing protein n=1 Tax=Paenibacillus sp. FSL R7-0210 TaxID=2921676 RepID=UPI0030F5C87B